MVSVCVDGLWRTSEDTVDTTWSELKNLICNKTAIPDDLLWLTPSSEDESEACGLSNGDEVMCEWALVFGRHPLHFAGNDFCPRTRWNTLSMHCPHTAMGTHTQHCIAHTHST